MKTVLLIRHAKSSWEDASISDFDRKLNDRGKRDAPKMAEKLRKKGLEPDLMVSSPARRAVDTAGIFAEEFGIKYKKIVQVDALYEPHTEVFSQVIETLDDDVKTVACFSHNPAITVFVNTLTPVRIDNMPTCGIFGVTVNIKHWCDFRQATKEFLFFDYPKL